MPKYSTYLFKFTILFLIATPVMASGPSPLTYGRQSQQPVSNSAEDDALIAGSTTHVTLDEYAILPIGTGSLSTTSLGSCVGIILKGYDSTNQLVQIGLMHDSSVNSMFEYFIDDFIKGKTGKFEMPVYTEDSDDDGFPDTIEMKNTPAFVPSNGITIEPRKVKTIKASFIGGMSQIDNYSWSERIAPVIEYLEEQSKLHDIDLTGGTNIHDLAGYPKKTALIPANLKNLLNEIHNMHIEDGYSLSVKMLPNGSILPKKRRPALPNHGGAIYGDFLASYTLARSLDGIFAFLDTLTVSKLVKLRDVLNFINNQALTTWNNGIGRDGPHTAIAFYLYKLQEELPKLKPKAPLIEMLFSSPLNAIQKAKLAYTGNATCLSHLIATQPAAIDQGFSFYLNTLITKLESDSLAPH